MFLEKRVSVGSRNYEMWGNYANKCSTNAPMGDVLYLKVSQL